MAFFFQRLMWQLFSGIPTKCPECGNKIKRSKGCGFGLGWYHFRCLTCDWVVNEAWMNPPEAMIKGHDF